MVETTFTDSFIMAVGVIGFGIGWIAARSFFGGK